MVYRDAGGHCLGCAGDLREVRAFGHRYQQCVGCGSALVSRATWSRMWSDIAPHRPPAQPTARSDGRARGCAVCGEPMIRLTLLHVPVDECQLHGLWFDRAELATALAGAALPPDEWLRLFVAALAEMS
jgi:hypothetical protein